MTINKKNKIESEGEIDIENGNKKAHDNYNNNENKK